MPLNNSELIKDYVADLTNATDYMLVRWFNNTNLRDVNRLLHLVTTYKEVRVRLIILKGKTYLVLGNFIISNQVSVEEINRLVKSANINSIRNSLLNNSRYEAGYDEDSEDELCLKLKGVYNGS